MIADLSTRQASQGSPATAGVDYTPVSDVRIVIPPGMASVNWIIDLNEDTEVEDMESFEVYLSNSVGCNIQGISSTRVDIYDDDGNEGKFYQPLKRTQFWKMIHYMYQRYPCHIFQSPRPSC